MTLSEDHALLTPPAEQIRAQRAWAQGMHDIVGTLAARPDVSWPGTINGLFYGSQMGRSGSITPEQAYGVLEAAPMLLPRATRFVRLDATCLSDFSAGAVLRMGVYAIDHPAATLVVDAGTVDLSAMPSDAFDHYARLPVEAALPAGLYGLAAVLQGPSVPTTGSFRRLTGTAGFGFPVTGFTNSNGGLNLATGVLGPLPASATVTFGASPIHMLALAG